MAFRAFGAERERRFVRRPGKPRRTLTFGTAPTSGEIKAIVARHKGTAVALFGSVARGEETPESDIDLLVDFGPTASLFDVDNIEFDVQDLLGCKVDVVSRGALNERDDDIRHDAIPL